jgi:hypothetical protein
MIHRCHVLERVLVAIFHVAESRERQPFAREEHEADPDPDGRLDRL